MLSLAKLAAPSRGEVSYYEASVARGRDDYYAGRGESPGTWCGTGSEAAGLQGAVGDGHLTQLLQGLHPTGGERVRADISPRLERVTVTDPATGQPMVVERERKPVAGFDATFSAPKSVSLLHALGDAPVQAAVRQAHEEAVHAALRYLEDTVCFTRTGRGGAQRVRGEGFLAAAFTHRLSRAQDPQLHTHVVIANAVRAADGRWRTLDGRGWAGHMLAAGYMYQSHLRALLVERLGVEFRLVARGQAEISGVPTAVLEAFSQRRQQVLEHMAATGRTGAAAGQVAVLATRPAKADADLVALRDDWSARAAELGLGRSELAALTPGPRERTPVEHERVEAAMVGAGGDLPVLTATQTAFRAMEIEMAWAEASPDGLLVEEVRGLAEGTRRRPELVPVGGGDSVGPRLLTTADVLDAQRRIERFLDDAQDRPSPLPTADVDRAVAVLRADHAAAVRHLLGAPGAVQALVGVAGGRKTTAIGAAVRIAAAAGMPVVLGAPSAQAAAVLAQAAGMPASTLHLQLASGGSAIPDGALVVIDEASMADTRTLARYLATIPDTARVVMVGDDHQLPAVGPGGAFAEVCRRVTPARLDRHLRQREPWEARCLDNLRTRSEEGVTAALAAWAEHGRVHQAEDRIAAEGHLVRAWWESAQTSGLREAVMIASTRGEVARLNAAARGLLHAAGQLGADHMIGRSTLATGDRVACSANRYDLGLRNGMAGTVLDVGAETVEVQFDDGQVVEIPADYIAGGCLDHRYALTGHRSQGGTFEHVHVLAPAAGQLAEWGYVALSRHRGPVHIYLCADPIQDAHIPEPSQPPQPLERLTQALRAPAAGGFVHPSQESPRRDEMTTRPEVHAGDAPHSEEGAWWDRYRHRLEHRPPTDDRTPWHHPSARSVGHLTTEQIRAERAFLERAVDLKVQVATDDLVRRRRAGVGERAEGAPKPPEPQPLTLDLDAVRPEQFVERLRQCDEVLRERARYGIDRIENLTTRALAAEARWLRLALDPRARASAEHTAALGQLQVARRDAQTRLEQATLFGRTRCRAELDRLTARIRAATEAAPPSRPLPEPPSSIKAAGIGFGESLTLRRVAVETALEERIAAANRQLNSEGSKPSALELNAVREAVLVLRGQESDADKPPVQRVEGISTGAGPELV